MREARGVPAPDPATMTPRPPLLSGLLPRVFVLIAGLSVLTLAIWLFLFKLAEQEPRARQQAQLIVSLVNMTRASLLHAIPSQRISLIRELSITEGLRLYPADEEDEVTPPPDDGFFSLLREALRTELGDKTRLALAIDGEPGLWTSFWIGDSDEYWIYLPTERVDPGIALHWFGWGLLAALMALAVAGYIVSRISRPLRALSAAANEIGQGRTPPPLLEEGADELRQVTAAFNQMSAELTRIARERAEVLAGISHDLRTPIARLRLEAEMSVPDDTARRGVVADLEQMDAIIGQFLDFARGDAPLSFAPLDLANWLRSLAERWQNRGCDVRYTGDDVPIALPAHAIALQRALDNLVENGLKYGAAPIQLDVRQEAGTVIVSVADQGSGIPAERRDDALRPFVRLDNARTAQGDVPGTGLGLAIVARTVRAHGGRLELDAAPAGGLLVRLVFPVG